MKAYRDFFQALIDELREDYNFTNAKKGQPQNWYLFSAGCTGLGYDVSFTYDDKLRVDLYVDKWDEDGNLAFFKAMESDKENIEEEFGEKLEWENLQGKRACRISLYRTGKIESDIGMMKDILKWTVEKLILFKKVFTPRIGSY